MKAAVAVLSLLLAGCAGIPTEPIADVVDEAPDEVLFFELPKDECYAYHNIPFTDVGWPNSYLPAGYVSADASSVWGMPVNFQFSALGIGLFGCDGDDPWQLGVLQVLIDPPAVEGIAPVEPTNYPSPFTATDGGFNMYALEFYTTGDLYNQLASRGWNVINATLDVRLPVQVPVVPHHDQQQHPVLGSTNGFWYAAGEVDVTLHDDDGLRSHFDNQLEIIWNHRNFEFQIYHQTPDGTGALTFTTGADHLLVGRGTCTHREDTLAHELFTEMEFLFPDGTNRPRNNGDCPDDGLGAMWMNFEAKAASIIDIPGAFAQ